MQEKQRRAGKIFMGNWEKIFAQLEKKLRATAEKTIGNGWRDYGQRFPLRSATAITPTSNVFKTNKPLIYNIHHYSPIGIQPRP